MTTKKDFQVGDVITFRQGDGHLVPGKITKVIPDPNPTYSGYGNITTYIVDFSPRFGKDHKMSGSQDESRMELVYRDYSATDRMFDLLDIEETS